MLIALIKMPYLYAKTKIQLIFLRVFKIYKFLGLKVTVRQKEGQTLQNV